MVDTPRRTSARLQARYANHDHHHVDSLASGMGGGVETARRRRTVGTSLQRSIFENHHQQENIEPRTWLDDDDPNTPVVNKTRVNGKTPHPIRKNWEAGKTPAAHMKPLFLTPQKMPEPPVLPPLNLPVAPKNWRNLNIDDENPFRVDYKPEDVLHGREDEPDESGHGSGSELDDAADSDEVIVAAKTDNILHVFIVEGQSVLKDNWVTLAKWLSVVFILLVAWMNFSSITRSLRPVSDTVSNAWGNAVDYGTHLKNEVDKVASEAVQSRGSSLSSPATGGDKRTRVKDSLGVTTAPIQTVTEVSYTTTIIAAPSGLPVAEEWEALRQKVIGLEQRLDYLNDRDATIFENLDARMRDVKRAMEVSGEVDRMRDQYGAVLEDLRQEIRDMRNKLSEPSQSSDEMMWYIQDQMNTLLDERLQDIQGDHSEERSESHRPDFALWGAGAEYIPSLTTQTYTPSMRSTLLSSFFSWLRSPIPIKSPVIALNEGTNPGECWPMKGSAGSLGVYLAADVVIDSVTLAHVPKSKWTSPKSGRSAPKEFEVWSVWDIEHFLRLNKDLETARHPIIVEGRRPPAVLLASGRFDPGTRDKEVFVVTEEAKRVTRHVFNHFGAGTSVIVLRILSNHGHPDYTCLYRISVHGHSVEGLLAQDEESGNVDM